MKNKLTQKETDKLIEKMHRLSNEISEWYRKGRVKEAHEAELELCEVEKQLWWEK